VKKGMVTHQKKDEQFIGLERLSGHSTDSFKKHDLMIDVDCVESCPFFSVHIT